MASIITSISLDAETMEIKDRVIANYGFSKFVRSCLREADAMANPTHTTVEAGRVAGYCNGLVRPACVICWPDGGPSGTDWLAFRSAERRVAGSGEKPSAQKQRIVKAALAESDAKREGQKTPTNRRGQKGLIRRFIGWIY